MRNNALIIAGLAVALAGRAAAQPENIGKVSQPLIAGLPVDLATQQARGLVTISVTLPVGAPAGTPTTTGTCSGTLINQYWVLTADHCVTTDGKRFGPLAPIAAFRISAAWSGQTPAPTKVVRIGAIRLRDVALIFLGGGDFGPAPVQELAARPVTDETTILKYGRGISAYARKGPPPVPAVADGQFRQANMLVTDEEDGEYTVETNGTNQQSAGGDSGGPDWIVAPGGRSLVAIAGVTSRGEAEYLDGMPRNWNWVTNVDDSTSSGVWDMRDEILEIVEPSAAAFCKDYATRAVAASAENARLMCAGTGERWTSSFVSHVNWCIGNSRNSDPANEESRARAAFLQSCLLQRCEIYAALAIAGTDENFSKKCGGSGERWSPESARHVNWCLSVRGDSAALNAETDARNAALQICRDNLRLRRAAETPAPLVGVKPGALSDNAVRTSKVSAVSDEAYCNAYAQEAAASAAENIAGNCGGVGGRWKTDSAAHVSWCMGLNGDRSAPQAEATARQSALAACKAAKDAPAEEPVEPAAEQPADPSVDQ